MKTHSQNAGFAARVLQAPIKFYQQARHGRPSPCRYQPSCSSYALEALSVHGAVRGSWLALRRLARCQPWGGHGWDPVPEPHAHWHLSRTRRAHERKVV